MKQKSIHIAALALALTLIVATCPSAATAAEGDAYCLDCHGNREKSPRELLYVNAEVLQESAHSELSCVDCHEDASATGSVAGAASPHPKRLQPVNCMGCHYKGNLEGAPDSSPMQQYKTSVHGRASIERGDTDVATCSDCHGKHNIRPASDPESTINRANIPRTCAVCHENMQMILKHNIHVEQPYAEYQQSVHGRASINKDGQVTIAATCTDCHGVHDIQASGEADLKPHLPGTCGRCHLNEYLAYARSIHGKDFKRQIPDAPVCADCHGEHNIASPWDPGSTVSAFNVANTCAKCHDDVTKMSKYNILTNKVSTYKHSDHGMGSDLGILAVATCISCHGYHEILPAYDPESSINAMNLKKTCGKPNCHPDPSPEILQAKIHVDNEDPDIESLRRIRSVTVWAIGVLLFSGGLVAGVMMFAARVRHRAEPPPPASKDESGGQSE